MGATPDRITDENRPGPRLRRVPPGATPQQLLTALNNLNADIRFARAFHVHSQVLIETEVLAEALDPAGFENACDCVASITLDAGPGLVERFGGRLTFAETVPDSTDVAAHGPVPTGQYL